MKKHGSTILLVLIFVLGLGLLLYPTVSNWWNQQHQSRAIASYSENVSNMKDEEKSAEIEKAKQYNESLRVNGAEPVLSEAEMAHYESILDITGTGIMGYIEIPSIDVSLPIYHGTEESVLQVAVGHLEWSSLPVGGVGTHSILSAHRGLPSAKLFTNLDKLVEGDIFSIFVLDERFTYQVDQILIVEPHEVTSLSIIPGRDLCTLVTCTPYGINTHRLLVRGHRIENPKETPKYNIIAEASKIDPIVTAPIIAIPFLLALVIYVLIKYRKKK